jgi:hypothetical protein
LRRHPAIPSHDIRRSRGEPLEGGSRYAGPTMPANWIWMQVAIVLFVAVGMIVAIVKLA